MADSGARAEVPVVAASTPTALRFALLAAPLIGATFLSKFGFPPLAALGIGVSIFFLLGAIAAGSVLGGVSIEPRRLAFFTAMLGILGVIQLFQPNSFSPSSLLLLAAVHLPYIFTVPGGDDKDRIIKFFLGIVLVFAWCGLAQYCLQFFVSPRFLFPIENFTPNTFIVQQFNHQAAMEYGSHEYRANGVFLLEPSFFSQVLAVAIIAELCTLGRMRRLAVYGLALVVSYSGTGLIVLAVCLPLCLIAQRRWGLLVFGLLVLAVIVPLQLHFHAIRLLSRIGELDSDQSSGYMRFVGGFGLFDKFLWQDLWRTLFGYGAGSFVSYSSRVHDYAAAEMALFKIVFEFGLVGAAAYFGFLFSCLYYSSAPRLLITAVAITYFLNGIYIPFAHGLALSLLLWTSSPGGRAWPDVPRRKPPREASSSAALALPRGIWL
ncbi:MAG TPA: hypothetical protein VHW95_08595 [Steroidobacteraceae bacterium]|jgi:hypothetical protein|nr:hypothetical protein [Steroidobacteraceae bacterium]